MGAHISDIGRFEVTLGVTRVPPLSHETAVIGNQHRVLLAVHREYGVVVVTGRSGEDIHLIIVACGQLYRIATALHAVRALGRGQIETDTLEIDRLGQQLGRERDSLAVEVGVRTIGVERCGLDVVGQLHRRTRHGSLRHGGSGEFHLEGLHGEGTYLEFELAALDSDVADLILDAVKLLGRHDIGSEIHHGLLRLLARGLIETHHVLVRLLGLLQSAQRNVVVLRTHEREAAAQRALMLVGSHERHERLVEHLGLRDGGGIAIVARVAHHRVGERVVSEILTILVRVTAAGLRSVQKRQADGVVVGLVPTVLAVVQHRHAVTAVGIRQIGPLLRVHLVCGLGVVAALYRAHAEVVNGLLVRDAERELGLKQRIGRLPVDIVHEVDAVALAALRETDILADNRLAVRALHAYRRAQRTLLHDGDLHILAQRHGLAVDSLLGDLPCGPSERLVLGEEGQTDRLAILDQLLAVAFVHDRNDIAVAVERDAIDAVLKRRLRSLQRGRSLRRTALADVVNGISRGGSRSEHQHAHRAVLRAEHLMGNPHALLIIYRHIRRQALDGHLHHIRHGESRGIVDHQRRTLHIGVERARNGAYRRGEHARELPHRDEFVVPRELVGARDAGARQVVVKLVPDEAFPRLGEGRAGIRHRAEPVGGHCAALGSVGQQLVGAVIELHRGLRRIATRCVHVHQQLAVPYGQLGVRRERQIILEELVARGAYDLHGTVAVHAHLQSADRLDGRGAARIARTVIVVNGLQGAGVGHAFERLALAQILQTPLGGIVMGIHHGHDARAVDTLPQTDLEGDLAVAVEGTVTPHEFLGREADQTAVRGHRGQRPAEAEAVGQEDVGALHAELVAIEVLTVEDVARERLDRGDVGIGGVPRTASDVPATRGDVVLHQLVLVGIVLLHPLVLDTALEVEDIVGVLGQQHEVLVERLGNVLRDGALNVPVPLRVEVSVRHDVGLVLLLGDGVSRKHEESHTQQ